MSANRPSAARRPPYAICAGTFLLLTACGITSETATGAHEVRAAATASAGVAGPQAAGERGRLALVPYAGRAAPGPYAPRVLPREIPALGSRIRGEIPADSRQALVVTGTSYNSSVSTAVLYTRDDPAKGWRAATDRWPAHNALKGWTDEHWEDDLRTPVGVYGLTAAGGLFAPPGTAFPYEQRPEFAVSGEGFDGEALEGSFDYVVAVDYNRVPGASPLDPVRPLGKERGGGIWIHVDHGGPTQGCISLPKNRMRELLRILDPEKKPVVVIGDAEALGR